MDRAGGKRGRGRPRGTTAARWAVRAGILDALASSRMGDKPPPTNAEIIAVLRAGGGFRPGSDESAERIVRDERAALLRHEPPHPSDPFVGFFDLPLATEADIRARDARAARIRQDKRIKAAERRRGQVPEKRRNRIFLR